MSTHTSRIQLTNEQLLDWQQQVQAVLDQNYREILNLVSKGLRNKEADKRLHTPSGTVKKHLGAAAKQLSRFAPKIGVLGLDRTGLSTVYRYAIGDNFRATDHEWVSQAYAALESYPGQKAILAQLPLGLSNSQIGQRNYLATTTIKTHLYRLRESLSPFINEAGITRLTRAGMAGMALMMGHTASAEIV